MKLLEPWVYERMDKLIEAFKDNGKEDLVPYLIQAHRLGSDDGYADGYAMGYEDKYNDK